MGAAEDEDVWKCRRCGWTYPNQHPSARHRRKHRKLCGRIQGYELHQGSAAVAPPAAAAAAAAAAAGSSDDATSSEDEEVRNAAKAVVPKEDEPTTTADAHQPPPDASSSSSSRSTAPASASGHAEEKTLLDVAAPIDDGQRKVASNGQQKVLPVLGDSGQQKIIQVTADDEQQHKTQQQVPQAPVHAEAVLQAPPLASAASAQEELPCDAQQKIQEARNADAVSPSEVDFASEETSAMRRADAPEEAEALAVAPEEAEAVIVAPEEAEALAVAPEEAEALAVAPKEAEALAVATTLPESQAEPEQPAQLHRAPSVDAKGAASVAPQGARHTACESEDLWERLLDADLSGNQNNTSVSDVDDHHLNGTGVAASVAAPAASVAAPTASVAAPGVYVNATNPFLSSQAAAAATTTTDAEIWNAFPEDDGATVVPNPFAGGETFRASQVDESDAIKPHTALQALFEDDVKSGKSQQQQKQQQQQQQQQLWPLMEEESKPLGSPKPAKAQSPWTRFLCCCVRAN